MVNRLRRSETLRFKNKSVTSEEYHKTKEFWREGTSHHLAGPGTHQRQVIGCCLEYPPGTDRWGWYKTMKDTTTELMINL